MKKYTFNIDNFNYFEELFDSIQYIKQQLPDFGIKHLENYMKQESHNNPHEIRTKNALKTMLIFEAIFREDNFLSKLHREKSTENTQDLLIQHYSVSFDQIENACNELGYVIDLDYLLEEKILVAIKSYIISDKELIILQRATRNYGVDCRQEDAETVKELLEKLV